MALFACAESKLSAGLCEPGTSVAETSVAVVNSGSLSRRCHFKKS